MKEKLDKINFKYKITLFTFILFLIIEALSPISGDDWRYFVIGKGGLVSSFENINILDGRIISGFLVNFFSYNKLLFDISFAFLISQFVKMCNDLMGSVKTKYLYLYPLIGVLLVSVFTFSYNYVSLNSTITYTFPSVIFIMYFYELLRRGKLTNKTLIKLLFYSIFICLSSIHIGITFLIANIIYFIIKGNKDKIKYIILLIIDLICIIFSLSLLENSLFYTNIESINNIPYLIENIFSNNILLIILGAIPINLYLYEKLKNNTYVRVIITLFDLILVFSLSYNFFNYSPVNLNLVLRRYHGIFAIENWYYIFYFIIYVVLFVLSLNYFIKNKRVKEMFNILMISSIILGIMLLVSPIFDKGNIILFILSLIMITCVLAVDMNTKVLVKVVKIVSVLLVVYYLSIFSVIKYIDVTRTSYIKEQLDEKSTNIEVKANPTYLIWRYNPVDYFQIKDFKEYYEIPDNNTIEVKYFGIFERVEKRIKE